MQAWQYQMSSKISYLCISNVFQKNICVQNKRMLKIEFTFCFSFLQVSVFSWCRNLIVFNLQQDLAQVTFQELLSLLRICFYHIISKFITVLTYIFNQIFKVNFLLIKKTNLFNNWFQRSSFCFPHFSLYVLAKNLVQCWYEPLVAFLIRLLLIGMVRDSSWLACI